MAKQVLKNAEEKYLEQDLWKSGRLGEKNARYDTDVASTLLVCTCIYISWSRFEFFF